MGRPLNKKYFGDAAGSLQVTSYRRSTGSEVTGEDDTYIVSQRSSNKFLVADTSGAWTEILTLVDTDQGSLLNGEFMVRAVEADGTLSRVLRFYNRTLRLTGPVKQKWDIADALDTAMSAVTLVTLTVVDVTVTSTTGFTTGDVVTFAEVNTTVELNGNSYTITVVDGTSITLDGTDGDNFTPGATTGVVTKASGTSHATPDVQIA